MTTRILQIVVEATLTRSPTIAILGPRQVGKITLARIIGGKKKGFHISGACWRIVTGISGMQKYLRVP